MATLAGCGSDGDSAAPPTAVAPAVASAQADAAAVNWNTSATVAVLANDTAANGTPAVSIKAAPAHGTATVEGNAVRYTPAAGYFGTDTLRYTLTVGDKTSEADVQLTVTAEFTLSGTVRDAPLAAASVVATVGATTLAPVTTAADGGYRLTLRTTDPTAFVRLTATGAGTQGTVVLASLLGDMRDIAALATAAGGGAFAVAPASLPAANVTHVSTATAALAQQVLGKPVGSSADLALAQGQFTGAQVVEVATAIKLVADLGVALPAGSATTLALATNESALSSFLLAQASNNAAVYTSAQQAVLNDAALAVATPVPTAAEPTRTLLFVLGKGAAASEAIRVQLNRDKTASYLGHQARSATWASDGAQVTLSFDSPIVTISSGPGINPVTRMPYRVEFRDTGFSFRVLGNPGSSTPASVRDEGSTYNVDGPTAGQSTPYDTAWSIRTALSTTKAFSAADVAPGTRWAGVVSDDANATNGVTVNQDVLRFVDATTVLYERANVAGAYRLVDGNIEVTVGTAVYTYSRLFAGPVGEERWLNTRRTGAAAQWASEPAVMKVQSGAAFTAAGLAQRWASYINAGITTDQFAIELLANGTGRGITTSAAGLESATPVGQWTLDAGGQMVFRRTSGCVLDSPGCAVAQTRSWQLMATAGKRIYVMERLIVGSTYDQYRLNVYSRP